MKRIFPSVPQSITVFLFWLLLVEDANAATLLTAALLSLVIPHIAARLEREFARLGAVWVLLPFGAMLLRDILVANLTVARQVLGPESRLEPGFIWIPLDLTNIHGISALTSVITLTPGTLTAELSHDRRHLLVHCLHVPDPQAAIDEIKQRYEAPLRRIFP
jgi:multicomponent K+:H+ antiporter subunit E